MEGRLDRKIIPSLPLEARVPFRSPGSNGIKRSSGRRCGVRGLRRERQGRAARLVAGNVRIVRCSQFYSEQLCNVGTDERVGEEKINDVNEKKKQAKYRRAAKGESCTSSASG